MARKNRIVIENGIYHVTARIAHRQCLLQAPEIKDKIVDWIYGIADFSGIVVLTWCVMDNHIHLLVQVPFVPKNYWIHSGTVPGEEWRPQTAAFSMCPSECRAPRWQPDLADLDFSRRIGQPITISPVGDSPSEDAVRVAVADGVPVVTLPRVPTGFALSDEEMIARLRRLHANHSLSIVEATIHRWAKFRETGQGALVEAEKDSLCRRMYNISQFMKTLKQRISQYLNSRYKHEGQLWDGRFYSGLVEDDVSVLATVAAYIDWNAPKAQLVDHPRKWNWCSYSIACGEGVYSARARVGYEGIFGCDWEEAKGRMESRFAEKLPETYDPAKSLTHYMVRGADGKERMVCLTPSQLVKSAAKYIFRREFISRHIKFIQEVMTKIPHRFSTPVDRVGKFLSECDWREPQKQVA